MEFLIEALFQIIGEFILQMLFEVAVDSAANVFAPGNRKIRHPIVLLLGYFIWGLIAGAVSLWPFPNAFVKSPNIRWLNLIFSPAAAGGCMSLIGRWRDKRSGNSSDLEKFGNAFAFALAMALVRLAFAKSADVPIANKW